MYKENDIKDETIEKLIAKLHGSPPGSLVRVEAIYLTIHFLFTDRNRLRGVVETHEANMKELLETYGIEIVPDPEPLAPDPKSLYSVLGKDIEENTE